VLATGWHPVGRTLVLAATEGDRTRFLAVPIAGGGQAVPILELIGAFAWQLRSDGGAFAIAFLNGGDSSRIATWEAASGAARWVTPDEPRVSAVSPVWSPDGTAIYYSEHADVEDRGIFRIGIDGSGRTQVHGPDRFGGTLVRVSPDGRWLIWTRGQAGGSTDALDLVTGANKSFPIAGTSGETAWRAARPRALVMSHGCCAGPPVGQLLLWDDVSGATTELIGFDSTPLLFRGAADWDPTGNRIAASVVERSATFGRSTPSDDPTFVAIFDAGGAYRARVTGTQGTGLLGWLPEGILVLRYPDRTAPDRTELALVSESGDDSRVLYGPVPSNFRIAGIVAP
jgi:hypothetical protein